MSVYSILTLDLNDNVSSTQRESFYKALAELQWRRISEMTTLWYATWKDDATHDGIVKTTKEDVAKAAKQAGIESYDASVAPCLKPYVWKA